MMRVILASASPRRLEILRSLGIDPEVRPADIDESVPHGADTIALARSLAGWKAESVHGRLALEGRADSEVLILAADTLVAVGGSILGKPRDPSDAVRMLERLAGRTHRVVTGLCLLHRAEEPVRLVDAASTDVRFRPMTAVEIRDYVATGEPMDKAGAYAIQGGAGRFVERVEGSYTNVVGFPVELFGDLLGRLGLTVESLKRPAR